MDGHELWSIANKKAWAKEYYEKNKEAKKEYAKQYREIRKGTYTFCECGSHLSYGQMTKHIKSKKHLKFYGDNPLPPIYIKCECGSRIRNNEESKEKHLLTLKHKNYLIKIT